MKELQIIKTELHIGLDAPVRLLHVTDSHICLANEADAAYDPELVDHAKQRGSAFGWGASIRMFGGMFGSLIGGTVIALTGTRGVFVFAAIMMFCLIPLVVGAIKTVQKNQNNQ